MKGKLHAKTNIHALLSTQSHADGKSGEALQSRKLLWSLTKKTEL